MKLIPAGGRKLADDVLNSYKDFSLNYLLLIANLSKVLEAKYWLLSKIPCC